METQETTSQVAVNSKKSNKNLIIIILVIAFIFIIAAISNPSKESQKNMFIEYFQTAMNDSNNNSLIPYLGIGMLAESLTSTNFVLFSLTYISFDSKSKCIGIAIFGNLFEFYSQKELVEITVNLFK